jgi:imidazolonepropionase
VPPEYQEDRDAYVALIRDEMLPAVAEEGLAEYCDVFCDEGIFTVEESRAVLEKAAELGMGLRVHAEELTRSGGATLAAELKAVSAEHLVHITGEQGEALAGSGTTAVLLPSTIFFLLKQKYAPALRLIDQGVPVAIATDCNPGSSNTESIPMAIVLACLKMGLSVEQAIAATTLNAAYAIRRHDNVGSLEVGKTMDVILLDAPSRIHLAYHFGVNIVDTVIKKGKVVVREGCRV